MTKKREPNPQPTTGTNYSTYLWPRAKDPAIQKIYDHLHETGWRFDAQNIHWYTPENEVFQAHGRLEYAIDGRWARIQPESSVVDGIPIRAEPIWSAEWSAPVH